MSYKNLKKCDTKSVTTDRQTDRQTDGRTDRRRRSDPYVPPLPRDRWHNKRRPLDSRDIQSISECTTY